MQEPEAREGLLEQGRLLRFLRGFHPLRFRCRFHLRFHCRNFRNLPGRYCPILQSRFRRFRNCLRRILRDYGEERYASRIAGAIVRALYEKRGLPFDENAVFDVRAYRESQYDALADAVR